MDDAIVPDAEMSARLNGLDKQVAFVDRDGRPLGYYLPFGKYKKLVLSQLEPPLSKEQMDKLRSEQGGSSLQEFWTKLHQRNWQV